MEKPLKKPSVIQHFSHEHLLERRLLPPEENSICFGCKLEVSPGKLCYKCKSCPFYLHQVCYKMPQKVQHPVDPNPNHHLTLLSMLLSNEKCIDCEACQQSISGFYYNCAICGTFYHMLCLATPLSVKLPVHPHKLDLEFSPPYKFQCDLCNRPSHQGWLYRCGLCEVDVHISCAILDSQDKLRSRATEPILVSGNVKTDGNNISKRQELMELLLQGIMDTQAQLSTPSTPLSDNCIATPSIQFSDACFSIDIERSFTGDGVENKEADFLEKVDESEERKNIRYVFVNKGTFQDQKSPSFGSYVGDLQKDEAKTLPGIGSQVWVELGRKTDPNQVTKALSAGGLKHHQAKKSGSGCCCSCW